MAVKPIPDGYPPVTPYLIVRGAGRAIEFYKQAFGAIEKERLADLSGRVGHAEIRFGTSPVMLADEHPEAGARSPESFGGSPVHLLLYVEDVDTCFQRAVDAGARVVRPLADQFYGDRSATILDPFGHSWTIATHKEDVSADETARRYEAAMKKSG